MNTIQQINRLVGNPDLYLLDHILKDRFSDMRRVLDAGCGEGRNLSYFVNENYEVSGADKDALAIRMCRMRFPHVPRDRFVCTPLSDIPFPDARFDLVISSAVLHFASSESEFRMLWAEHTRVTAPGGLLFLRMASLWGGVSPSDFPFYLTDEILELMLDGGWTLAEPVKTVLVNRERSMASLLLERR